MRALIASPQRCTSSVLFFSCQGRCTGESVETLGPVLLQGGLSGAQAWHVVLWKAKGKIMFCSALSDGTILLMPWTKAGFIRPTWLPPFPQWHPEWNLGGLDDEDVQVSETRMTLTDLNSFYRVTVNSCQFLKSRGQLTQIMGRGFSSISLANDATFLTMLAGILGFPFRGS